jgi:hypothetical protein
LENKPDPLRIITNADWCRFLRRVRTQRNFISLRIQQKIAALNHPESARHNPNNTHDSTRPCGSDQRDRRDLSGVEREVSPRAGAAAD